MIYLSKIVYVVGRISNKVMDCYEDVDSSCKDTSDAIIENVKRIVNSMCTEKNMGGWC